jgi:hypothetical protein
LNVSSPCLNLAGAAGSAAKSDTIQRFPSAHYMLEFAGRTRVVCRFGLWCDRYLPPSAPPSFPVGMFYFGAPKCPHQQDLCHARKSSDLRNAHAAPNEGCQEFRRSLRGVAEELRARKTKCASKPCSFLRNYHGLCFSIGRKAPPAPPVPKRTEVSLQLTAAYEDRFILLGSPLAGIVFRATV